jgi:hypothetical protein
MLDDTPRRPTTWFDNKISLGNLVTWVTVICGLVASYTWVQADVRTLQEARQETKEELRELKRRQEGDREAIMEMKGDVRAMKTDVHFIRQALDAASRRP